MGFIMRALCKWSRVSNGNDLAYEDLQECEGHQDRAGLLGPEISCRTFFFLPPNEYLPGWVASSPATPGQRACISKSRRCSILQGRGPPTYPRYGACFAIALAYAGTSQNAAIRRLLHMSVSDVSDDVRRAAVMSLGFVMCNQPEQLPGVVKLLSESYNPHVRYAAAMALGFACAGSANKEAPAGSGPSC